MVGAGLRNQWGWDAEARVSGGRGGWRGRLGPAYRPRGNKEKLRSVWCRELDGINLIHILQRSWSSEWKMGWRGPGDQWVPQVGAYRMV